MTLPILHYDEFLSRKKLTDIPSGFEAVPRNGCLFDFQKVIVGWALRRGRAAIFANTGLGKTLMQTAWAEEVAAYTGLPVLILAPLSVAKQTVREAAKFGIAPVTYIRHDGDVKPEPRIWITNYEMLDKFDLTKFVGLVLDECFTPDTEIDVLSIEGEPIKKHIKDVRPGDSIINASGVDRVSDVHRREVQYAVTVTAGNRVITSSPNHPYFTQRGWVGAVSLCPGDYIMETSAGVRLVQEGIYAENCTSQNDEILRKILFSEMAHVSEGESGKNSFSRSSKETRNCQVCMVQDGWSKEGDRADNQSESYAKPGNAGESEPHIESDEAQTFRAWGERSWFNSPSTNTEGCTITDLGGGISFITGPTASGIPDALQARLGLAGEENRHRGGWNLSPRQEGNGCKEGRQAGFVRVDGIEVLEQGHPELEKYRNADGKLYFYDIGATRHPSFSVNGLLVHNSSILKSYDGKTRTQIIEASRIVPYRLSCTATPSPNDFMELGNQAEFAGVMSRVEMLAMFFTHDGGDTSNWRLKKHGAVRFWEWMASWSVVINSPADLGFDGSLYELPPLVMHEHHVNSGHIGGDLFGGMALSLTDQRTAKRASMSERVEQCAHLVNSTPGPWLVWCHLNSESEALAKAIPCSVAVAGSDSMAHKENAMDAFSDGTLRVLISKSSICGFGMNFQHCAQQAFVGIDHSFEMFYQAIRRSWRFGQTRQVDVHVFLGASEGLILDNLKAKEARHNEMSVRMAEHMRTMMQQNIFGASIEKSDYVRDVATGPGWEMHLGDCVDVVGEIDSDTIDYSIFSPPFASLFTYSNSDRDMGNCTGVDEFYGHFDFLVSELLRVTKPGRLLSFHCMNLPISKQREGYIGIRDFRGELVALFVKHGWIFHSEVCIWKDPVTAMQRTKALGLLHKQIKKDSTMSRQGIPDYLVTMRKPGTNPDPVTHTNESFPVGKWQNYASPVWMDINQSRTLQFACARDNDDERHICLSAGSLVLTREHGYLEIEDVNPGYHVLTHLGRWKPVIAKKCNGISETIRVSGQGVADLKVTPEHELWTRYAYGVRAKENAKRHDPEWIEAKDSLASYVNLQLPPEEESELTEQEWWIVGRWLGDGHRGTRRTSGKRGKGLGQFIISCNHNEVDDLESSLGTHAGSRQKISATQINLINLRDEVRNVLNRCGEGAENKRIPGEAFCLNKNKSEALLSGYLSADGHYVKKHDRVMASSVSRALLLGMAIVAQRARNVVASVYPGRPERNGSIQGRNVSMKQDWIFAFRNSEGYKKSGWIDDLGAWKKVRKIEDSGDCAVWDLQVADDASFTAEGCVVHNCPLQLDVIERAIDLWTNPGDLVLSPFGGIGSEPVTAVSMGRRAVAVELKPSYWQVAVKNLRESAMRTGDLFDMAA